MSETLRILIVDDDRRMIKTLVDILLVNGYKAEAAYSAEEALEKVEAEAFECVLTDIKMPGVNGVELYRAIKELRPDLPVVLMTAYATDELVKEGLEEGAIAALVKPLDINQLLGFFSSLRKERSIVIVDDDPGFCKTLGDILRERGYAVISIANPKDLLEKLDAEAFQIVLLDMKLAEADGLDVLQETREHYPHLPVILVTGCREEMASSIEAGLKFCAYTCLYKPVEIEELLHVLAEVHRRELGRLLGRYPRKRK